MSNLIMILSLSQIPSAWKRLCPQSHSQCKLSSVSVTGSTIVTTPWLCGIVYWFRVWLHLVTTWTHISDDVVNFYVFQFFTTDCPFTYFFLYFCSSLWKLSISRYNLWIVSSILSCSCTRKSTFSWEILICPTVFCNLVFSDLFSSFRLAIFPFSDFLVSFIFSFTVSITASSLTFFLK